MGKRLQISKVLGIGRCCREPCGSVWSGRMFQVDPYSRAIPTAQGHSCGIGMRMRNAAYHANWPDRLTPRTDGHLEGWNAQCSEGLACGQSAEVKLRLTLANAAS